MHRVRSVQTTLPKAVGALCAVAALGAVAPATGSAAAPVVVSANYDVTSEGVYHLKTSNVVPGALSASLKMDLGWHTETATSVSLSRARTTETSVAETEAPQASLDGRYESTVYTDPPETTSCAMTLAGPPTKGIVGARTDEQGITVEADPFGTISSHVACDAVGAMGFAVLGRDLATKVKIPAERLGDASITVPFESGEAAPCPSIGGPCEVSFSGQLTLTRRSVVTEQPAPGGGGHATPPPAPQPQPTPAPEPGIGDDLLAPLTPSTPATTPPASPPVVPPAGTGAGAGPGGSAGGPAWPLPGHDAPAPPWIGAGQQLEWDADRGVLVFGAACAGGCAGTATVTGAATPRAARATLRAATGTRRAARRFGVVRFTVAPGAAHRSVRLRLPAATRRKLERAGRGRLSLTLRDRASGATTTTQRVLAAGGR